MLDCVAMPYIITLKTSEKTADFKNRPSGEYHIVAKETEIDITNIQAGTQIIAKQKTLSISGNLSNCSITAKNILIQGSIEQTQLNADNDITIHGEIRGNNGKKNELTAAQVHWKNSESAMDMAITTHDQANIKIISVQTTTSNPPQKSSTSIFSPKPTVLGKHSRNPSTTLTTPSNPVIKKSKSFTPHTDKSNTATTPINKYFKHPITKPKTDWKEKTRDFKLIDAKELDDAAINAGIKFFRQQIEQWLLQANKGEQPNYLMNGKPILLRFIQFRAFVQYYNGIMENKNYPIFKLPTGIGKTFIFITILHHLLMANRNSTQKFRVMILTPNINTVDQISEEFKQYASTDLKVAVHHSGKHDPLNDYDVLVTTPQSLMRDQKEPTPPVNNQETQRKKVDKFNYKKNNFKIIVRDEAHLGLSESRLDEMKNQKNSNSGVQQIWSATATPTYTVEKNVYIAMGYQGPEDKANPISPGSTLEGIDEGELSPVTTCVVVPKIKQQEQEKLDELFNINSDNENSDNETTASANIDESISKIINTEVYNRLASKFYFTEKNDVTQQYFNEEKCIIFSAGIDHAEALEKIFNEYEPGCTKCVHSKKSLKENDSILAEHRAGKFKVIINANKLAQGHNDPYVTLVINLNPVLSRVLGEQRGGRGIRWLPFKIATIVDFYWGVTRQVLFKHFIGNKYLAGIPDNFVPLPPQSPPSEEMKAKFESSNIASYQLVWKDSDELHLGEAKRIKSLSNGKKSSQHQINIKLLNDSLGELEQIISSFQEKLKNLNLSRINTTGFRLWKNISLEKKPAQPGTNINTHPNSPNVDLINSTESQDIQLHITNLHQAIKEMVTALLPEEDDQDMPDEQTNEIKESKKEEKNPAKNRNKLTTALRKLQQATSQINAFFSQINIGISLPSLDTLTISASSSITSTEEDISLLLNNALTFTENLKNNIKENSDSIIANIQKKSEQTVPVIAQPTSISNSNANNDTNSNQFSIELHPNILNLIEPTEQNITRRNITEEYQEKSAPAPEDQPTSISNVNTNSDNNSNQSSVIESQTNALNIIKPTKQTKNYQEKSPPVFETQPIPTSNTNSDTNSNSSSRLLLFNLLNIIKYTEQDIIEYDTKILPLFEKLKNGFKFSNSIFYISYSSKIFLEAAINTNELIPVEMSADKPNRKYRHHHYQTVNFIIKSGSTGTPTFSECFFNQCSFTIYGKNKSILNNSYFSQGKLTGQVAAENSHFNNSRLVITDCYFSHSYFDNTHVTISNAESVYLKDVQAIFNNSNSDKHHFEFINSHIKISHSIFTSLSILISGKTRKTNIQYCNFKNSALRFSKIFNFHLNHVDLTNANLCDTVWASGTIENCILNDTTSNNAIFKNVTLKNIRLAPDIKIESHTISFLSTGSDGLAGALKKQASFLFTATSASNTNSNSNLQLKQLFSEKDIIEYDLEVLKSDQVTIKLNLDKGVEKSIGHSTVIFKKEILPATINVLMFSKEDAHNSTNNNPLKFCKHNYKKVHFISEIQRFLRSPNFFSCHFEECQFTSNSNNSNTFEFSYFTKLDYKNGKIQVASSVFYKSNFLITGDSSFISTHFNGTILKYISDKPNQTINLYKIYTSNKCIFEITSLSNLSISNSDFYSQTILIKKSSASGHIKIEHCLFQKSNWALSTIINFSLKNVDLVNANLQGTHWENGIFENCNLSEIVLKNAFLKNVTLKNIKLAHNKIIDFLIISELKINENDNAVDTISAIATPSNARPLPPTYISQLNSNKPQALNTTNTYNLLSNILSADNSCHLFDYNFSELINYNEMVTANKDSIYWFPLGKKPIDSESFIIKPESSLPNINIADFNKHYYYNTEISNYPWSNNFTNSSFEKTNFTNTKKINKFINCVFNNFKFQSNNTSFSAENSTLNSTKINALTLNLTNITKFTGEKNYFYITQPNSILNNNDFSNDNFMISNLSKASINNCNYSNANFLGTSFKEATIKNSNFFSANLEKADLSNAKLTNVDFTQANLKNSRWDNVSLENCMIAGHKITGFFLANTVFENIESFLENLISLQLNNEITDQNSNGPAMP